MKQAADKFTGDMWGGDQPTPAKKPKPMYRAYVAMTGGEVLVWTHLTLAQSKAMHKMCSEKFNVLQSSTEITRFGWEEMA